MAEHGWYYCQLAVIEMQLIHPWTDYQPAIDDEFKETFNARYKDDPLTLTIYERDGKLIMANDWEAYWMYRHRQDINAVCIIIGHFSQVPGIAVLERPFMIQSQKN